jgi:hypothetical protein
VSGLAGPEFFVIFVVFLLVAAVGVVPIGIGLFAWTFGRRARRFGYPSAGAYLRSAPGSDAEKRDAADLAIRGLVLCVLGVLLPPFVLIGLVPLFYGGRKLLYATMGLGLVDEADLPRA